VTRYLFCAALALPLIACTPVANTPVTAGSDAASTSPATAATAAYLALGTEPGWTIEITPATLNYNGDYGQTQIIVPNPGAKPSFNGERYITDRISVDVTHAPCNDGMSDRRYADTVMVRADGKEFRGCGGAILPPANLSGTQWTIQSINGQNILSDRATEVRFEGGQISGRAGCNRFSGPYSSDGKRLSVATMMTTRMACPDPQEGASGGWSPMAQEQAFFALLGEPISLRFTPEGQLNLVGVGGKSAVLVPVK
jgi:heat shock protein HslJ